MTTARRLLTLLSLLVSAVLWAAPPDLPQPQAGKLTVYYFDVGQGDSALIVSPTGKTVLVDAGPPEAAESLAHKVAAVTHGPLDLVILTHPHLDHLGGMTRVLRAVGAKRYLDPEFDHPSTSYKELLDFVANKEIPVLEANPGPGGEPFSLGIGEGAELKVYWPRRPEQPFFKGTRSDPNANSIVFRLTWQKTAFLFTGDSEAETEQELMRRNVPLHANVLKVAHHGSRHSSEPAFLARVAPKIAVISCGAHNDYGHPTPETLERLEKIGAKIFRTDLQGDVEAVSDGTGVQVVSFKSDASAVESKRPDAPKHVETVPASASSAAGADVAQGYAASSRSKVFHRADCPAVKRISPKNLVHYGDREAASKGRRPAADCHP